MSCVILQDGTVTCYGGYDPNFDPTKWTSDNKTTDKPWWCSIVSFASAEAYAQSPCGSGQNIAHGSPKWYDTQEYRFALIAFIVLVGGYFIFKPK